MLTESLIVYFPVILLVSFAFLIVLGALLLGKLIRPNNPNLLKEQAYECGENPVGTAWGNFNIRFYVIAIIFIIFDVEGALMFPLATVFKKFSNIGLGLPLFFSFLLFLVVLITGVIYCWKKGDLEWVKNFQEKA